MIKIVIFEDNTEFRDALKTILHKSNYFEIVGTFPSCDEIDHYIPKMQPDVVLMDIDMPGKDGIEGLKYLQKNHPHIRTLMLTWVDEEDKIEKCIRLGAAGYILKDHGDDNQTIDVILKTYEESLQKNVLATYQKESPMSPSVAAKMLKKFRNMISGSDEASANKDLHWDFNDNELAFLFGQYYALSYAQIARAYSRGVDAIRAYQRNINTKTDTDPRDVARRVALHYGSFFIPKMLAERILAQAGDYGFNPEEIKALEGFSRDQSQSAIATDLSVTENQVALLVESIYGKLRK